MPNRIATTRRTESYLIRSIITMNRYRPSGNDRTESLANPVVLLCTAVLAVASALARGASGELLIPAWLHCILQAPLIIAWLARCARAQQGSGAKANLALTILLLVAAAAIALHRDSVSIFFLAATIFITGALVLDALQLIYRRIEERIDRPRALAAFIWRPWLITAAVATGLLCLPLATSPAVQDYRHAHLFWNHCLNNAFAALSAACLYGTMPYDLTTDYTPFGRFILAAVAQLAGLGFTTLGLAAIRPFLRRRIRLQTVLLLAVGLQSAGMLVMAAHSPSGAPDLLARIAHAFTHAGGAVFNSGLTITSRGVNEIITDRTAFITLSTLAVAGSIGLPILLDLFHGRSTNEGPRSGPYKLFGKLSTSEGAEGGPHELPSQREGKNEMAPANANEGMAQADATQSVAQANSLCLTMSQSHSLSLLHRIPNLEAAAALVLMASGAALLFAFESPSVLPQSWTPDRPFDLGEHRIALRDETSAAVRWRRAVFTAATLRSAGFESTPVSKGALSQPSNTLVAILMMIGGSAAGCAGGIRTTTLIVLGVCLMARRRTSNRPGNDDDLAKQLFRRIGGFAILWIALNAMTVVVLIAVTGASPHDAALEGIAALNNVRLSTDLALHLTPAGGGLIITVLTAGRWIPVIFWLDFAARLRFRLSDTTCRAI